MRKKKNSSENNRINEKKNIIVRADLSLFQTIKNRFVGIDSLMTVHSKEDKSFRLYIDSFNERFSPGKMSFYESEFNINVYSKALKENKRNHFITVPGIIAHLYYTGSIPFLVFFCFLLSLIFTYLEIFIVRNYNLPCLACITSFIFSYRLAHFGYAPQQSYKLILGVIIFFVILIILNYFLNGAKKSKISR